MSQFNYALALESYTWKNALFWGNCTEHWKKALTHTSRWGHRCVHVLIALAETLPIISQIASIFEKLIINPYGRRSNSKDIFSNKPSVKKLEECPVKPRENSWEAYEATRKQAEELKVQMEKQNERINQLSKAVASLEKKADPKSSMNCFAMHLMMDKLFIKETDLEGANDTIAMRDLEHAFKRLRENEASWILEEPIKEWLRKFLITVFPILEKYTELARLKLKIPFGPQNEEKEIAKKNYLEMVLEFLKSIEVGNSLLIPIGCKQHSTNLLIKKLTPSSFRLIHYNTGYGVDHHHRYPATSLFQTCDILDEVPAESVLNEEEWKAHFMELKDKEDMNFAYDWIRNHIGKGGIRLPASLHEEEYEAIQFSGTCPTQSKMAWLRHEIMQNFPGTAAEKEACYKIIKTHLFLQFIQDHENNFDECIKNYIPSILEKLKAEQTLFQMASHEPGMQEAIKIFNDMLSEMGEKPILNALPAELSVLSRYALLRKWSLLVFQKLRTQNKEISPELSNFPALKLVTAKLNHYKCIKANIVILLDHLAETNDKAFADKLSQILANTPYTEIGIVEAFKHLGKEIPTVDNPPKKTEKVLEKLEKHSDTNTPIVERLHKAFNDGGNHALADWLMGHWKGLKKEKLA